MSALRSLERYARPRPRQAQCELCAEALPPGHPHVADLTGHRLLCACPACALLFKGAGEGRFRTVPEQVRSDRRLVLTDADWNALGVPVALAFCFHRASLDRWLALFPSPGGATEAELPAPAWREFAERNELIRSMQSDVEALLVRRDRSGRFECYVTPIDVCYRLVATIRQHWRGLDGGDRVRQELDASFVELRSRSERQGGGPGAALASEEQRPAGEAP